MKEINNCNKDCNQEILVGNILFKCDLNQVNEYTYDLAVTPCNVPTSVFCIARITVRENCCNNILNTIASNVFGYIICHKCML